VQPQPLPDDHSDRVTENFAFFGGKLADPGQRVTTMTLLLAVS